MMMHGVDFQLCVLCIFHVILSCVFPLSVFSFPLVSNRKKDAGVYCLARDVIYTSRTYATMSVSVCLSVTEVHWRIMANLGFKFRSKFTAHCRRGEGSSQQQHLALC